MIIMLCWLVNNLLNKKEATVMQDYFLIVLVGFFIVLSIREFFLR